HSPSPPIARSSLGHAHHALAEGSSFEQAAECDRGVLQPRQRDGLCHLGKARPRRLNAGDCLTMRLDCPIVYHNPTRRPARYLVALTTVSAAHWRP
ncbi:hypothetical protein, partial [Escherichia coli]|uniref:hypothetical protein n=1 Tax=Escherichia coli TaxID=562 RepID=UPI001F169BB4